MPVNYDVVISIYWVEDPIAYEHDDLFYILGVSQLLIIYIYIYACLCVCVCAYLH